MQYWPARFEFRREYLYCNYGYVLAARALEEVTKKSWEELMRERLFEPLGENTEQAWTFAHIVYVSVTYL